MTASGQIRSHGFTGSPVGRTLLLAIALLSIAAGLLPAPALGFFGKAKSFATERNVGSPTVGDFNGDGNPDLAAARFRGGISVLFGNGDGGFGKPKRFAAGPAAGSLAIDDLNGDSRPDLLVDNGRSVSVLLNGRSSAALSLSYEKRGHRFSGGLRSIDPVCANRRWVVVLRRRKGPDRKVGEAMTSRKGTYSIRRNASGGTYYAHARSSPACRAESSKTIALR